jgi:hypothetical protein
MTAAEVQQAASECGVSVESAMELLGSGETRQPRERPQRVDLSFDYRRLG